MLRETLEAVTRKLGSEAAAVPRVLEALRDETGRVSPAVQQGLVELLSKAADVAGTVWALE